MDSSDDQFCLSYEEFGATVQKIWKQFEFEKDFCDVILACDGQQIQTHRVILSSYSPVIRDILKQNSNQNPIIFLRGVKFSDLQNLVTFIYQGEVKISENSIGSFLAVAKDLEISGLHVDFERKAQTKMEEEAILPDEHLGTSDSKQSLKKARYVNKEHIDNQETESASIQTVQNDLEGIPEGTPILKDNKEIVYQEKKIDQNLIPIDQNIFSCEKCGSDFPERSSLYEHKIYHHKEKRYPCGECDYQATTRSSLRDHIKSIHEGIRYPCDQCEHKASRKPHLRKHIEVMHEGIRYPCDKCDYKATDNSFLKRHKQSAHEGICYPCQHCDYKAALKFNLHKHIKNVHR